MAMSDNIWWTRKAKICSEKRLLVNSFNTQVLLLWYSFCGVAVSIYHLNSANGVSDVRGVTWVVFSVLIFGISGFINGLSFKERATLIKECYETLHGLYRRSVLDESDQSEIQKEYELVLGVCENHSDYDFFSAVCIEHWTHSNPTDPQFGLSIHPTTYMYAYVFTHRAFRVLLFLIFYLLPVALLGILELRFCW